MPQELPPSLQMFYRWRALVATAGVLVAVGMSFTWWLIDGSSLGLALVPFGALGSVLIMCLYWVVNHDKLEPMGFRW